MRSLRCWYLLLTIKLQTKVGEFLFFGRFATSTNEILNVCIPVPPVYFFVAVNLGFGISISEEKYGKRSWVLQVVFKAAKLLVLHRTHYREENVNRKKNCVNSAILMTFQRAGMFKNRAHITYLLSIFMTF